MKDNKIYERVKTIDKEKRAYDTLIQDIEESPFSHTTLTKEELYKESKKALKKALLSSEFIVKTINEEIKLQEEEKENPNKLSEFIKAQRQAVEKFKENIEEYELTQEEIQYILNTYSKEISEEEIIEAFNISINNLKKTLNEYLKASSKETYKKYVNDLVDNVYIKYKFFVKYQEFFEILLSRVYVRDKALYSDCYILHLSEELKNEIYEKLSIKRKLLLKEQDKEKEEKDNVINYIQEELSIIEYDDKAIMYRNALTNIVSKEKNNNIVNYANKDIELKPISIEKNNEIINEKLEPYDLQVLDFIIDKFYKRGYLEFTDTQIANYMYEEKGTKAHIEDRRKVNESILKIQSIRLSLDFRYKQDKKAKVWSNNPLIWLKHVGANIDSEVNKYRILGKPFYLDFIELSDTKAIEYPRKILYLRSNNKYKTIKSHNVRIYLVEQIKTLPNEDKHYISIETLYNIMNITKEKYQSPNTLKKERSKGLKIVKDAFKDIKSEGLSFYYSEDNSSRTIKGYWISKKPIID